MKTYSRIKIRHCKPGNNKISPFLLTRLIVYRLRWCEMLVKKHILPQRSFIKTVMQENVEDDLYQVNQIQQNQRSLTCQGLYIQNLQV